MVCSEAGFAANSKCPAENCRPPKLRVIAWTKPIAPKERGETVKPCSKLRVMAWTKPIAPEERGETVKPCSKLRVMAWTKPIAPKKRGVNRVQKYEHRQEITIWSYTH